MHAATDIGSAVDWLQSQVDLSYDENGCLCCPAQSKQNGRHLWQLFFFGSVLLGPDDEAFLLSLRRSLKTARGAYPPFALAEIYQEYSPLTKIRRLHLMVVDLGRSRSVSPQVVPRLHELSFVS